MIHIKHLSRKHVTDDELIDFLYSVLGSLSAGYSLAQVLDSQSPVSSKVSTAPVLNGSVEERINQYFSHPSLSYARAGLLYSTEMGTPVLAHLEKAIQLIKDKSALKKKRLILTEQARMSALIISLVPLLLCILLLLLSPAMIKPLVTSLLGWCLLLISLALNSIAFWMMRRLMAGEK